LLPPAPSTFPLSLCSCIFLLARSSHRADGAPEASVRDAEESGADRGEREELRPDDIQARRPIEDALPQNHEVSGGRCKHHELHELGMLSRGVKPPESNSSGRIVSNTGSEMKLAMKQRYNPDE
jgi:hypothetical protein